MSLFDYLFLLLILFANLVQAITGFAGTALAMPFAISLVGENEAKAVLNLVALPICFFLVIAHFKDIDWKKFLVMILFVGLGFGVGYLIDWGLSSASVNRKIIELVYASLVCALACVFFFLDPNKHHLPKPVLWLFLFLGGIVHEMFVSGGPLVVLYATQELKSKNTFRSTLSLMWILLNTVLFTEHYLNGYFSPKVWILFGLGSAVSILSAVAGHFVAKKLSLSVFLKVSYVLLFVSGAILIVTSSLSLAGVS